MTSKFFIFPANREAAIRALYSAQGVRDHTNPNEDEQVGTIQFEAAPGTRGIIGSSRVSDQDVIDIVADSAPWLEVMNDWPNDWIYPDINI